MTAMEITAAYHHILARGATHLPYAPPNFVTPCVANAPRPEPAGSAAWPKSMLGNLPHAGRPNLE